jgi:hypothetical protein
MLQRETATQTLAKQAAKQKPRTHFWRNACTEASLFSPLTVPASDFASSQQPSPGKKPGESQRALIGIPASRWDFKDAFHRHEIAHT